MIIPEYVIDRWRDWGWSEEQIQTKITELGIAIERRNNNIHRERDIEIHKLKKVMSVKQLCKRYNLSRSRIYTILRTRY